MKYKIVEIVLSYRGKYGIRRVPSNWTELFLPARHMSSYIKEAENVETDEDVRFVPSGKQARRGDNVYDIWVEKGGKKK